MDCMPVALIQQRSVLLNLLNNLAMLVQTLCNRVAEIELLSNVFQAVFSDNLV